MRRGEAWRGSIPPRYVSPRRLSLTILLDVFLVSSLAAQSALNALAGSTRSAGLGGAGVALVGDAGALFANPAAIATVRRLAFEGDRKSTRLNSSHGYISYAVFCLKKKKKTISFTSYPRTS